MSLAVAWDAEHSRREWGRWPDEHLVRFVARAFPQGIGTALDLGCGGGAQTFFLATEAGHVEGIDASQAAIRRCGQQQRFRPENESVRLRVGPVTNLPWTAPTFDLVVDVCCLQHLNDTEIAVALDEVYRVLKPGGRIFSKHYSAAGWPGINNVGPMYPRRAHEVAALYGATFECDYFHDQHERRHPDDRSRKVLVAHWIIEGRKA